MNGQSFLIFAINHRGCDGWINDLGVTEPKTDNAVAFDSREDAQDLIDMLKTAHSGSYSIEVVRGFDMDAVINALLIL